MAGARDEGLPCSFVRASVADLSFLRLQVTLAVDVGCFHSLTEGQCRTYIRSLADCVAPGGYYFLYAFVRPRPGPADGPSSDPAVTYQDIAAFAPWFVLRSASHGEDRGRTASWFWMQRAVTAGALR